MTNGKERFAIWIRDNHSLESKVDAPSRYGTPHSSQLEAAFADYGAPKAYNDYPVLRPRRRLGVVGLRLLFLAGSLPPVHVLWAIRTTNSCIKPRFRVSLQPAANLASNNEASWVSNGEVTSPRGRITLV